MDFNGENPALESEIERYLKTGDHDQYYRAWPEGGMLLRAQKVDAALRKALIERVQNCARGASAPLSVPGVDLTALTRAKVLPMINGLFPHSEHYVVVGVLERSVVFLTPENIVKVLEKVGFLSTAWDLANLYLASIGAPGLSEEAMQLEGLSQETTCFVSMRYFSQNDRFADFIVHEAAHIFHNCKRETIGLPHTRAREWLLEIDFRKRETFAYACEAYSRILELSSSRAQQKALLDEKESCYTLRVMGDSMSPDSLDGDIVMMDYARQPRNGDIVAALIDGHESTLKIYSRQGDEITLKPIETQHHVPRTFHASRITIQGALIEIVRRIPKRNR